MKWENINILLLLLCVAGLIYSDGIHKNNHAAYEKQIESDASEKSPDKTSTKTEDENKPSKEQSKGEVPADVKPDTQSDQTMNQAEDKIIRVLIKTQDFAGDYHSSLTLVCNSNTKTEDGSRTFAAGDTISLDTGSDLFDGEGVVKLFPEDENAGFTVTSMKRGQGTPTYEGKLEIYRSGEGMLLIDVLNLEIYLKYVVPSEMPSNYEVEALKAQSVCARTYAYKHMLDASLSDKHADVDDSVSYQVYNNISRQEVTDRAVNETAGQVMLCDGKPITAYFFSTSSGATSTNEVWSESPEKYLQCVNSGGLESSEPWFRWNVTLPLDYLNRQIEKYAIGTLKDIMILKKSSGGAVDEMKLVGSDGEKTLDSEYKIRQVLSTKGIPVKKQDGTTTTQMDLMPSAYFTCSPVYDQNQVTGYYFEGGGYGHGVGMSQNGANHLAASGKNWQEILNYFYREIDVCPIP